MRRTSFGDIDPPVKATVYNVMFQLLLLLTSREGVSDMLQQYAGDALLSLTHTRRKITEHEIDKLVTTYQAMCHSLGDNIFKRFPVLFHSDASHYMDLRELEAYMVKLSRAEPRERAKIDMFLKLIGVRAPTGRRLTI